MPKEAEELLEEASDPVLPSDEGGDEAPATSPAERQKVARLEVLQPIRKTISPTAAV